MIWFVSLGTICATLGVGTNRTTARTMQWSRVADIQREDVRDLVHTPRLHDRKRAAGTWEGWEQSNLVFPQGTCEPLGPSGTGNGAYLNLGQAELGVFGGVDHVALQGATTGQVSCATMRRLVSPGVGFFGLTASAISQPPPSCTWKCQRVETVSRHLFFSLEHAAS